MLISNCVICTQWILNKPHHVILNVYTESVSQESMFYQINGSYVFVSTDITERKTGICMEANIYTPSDYIAKQNK